MGSDHVMSGNQLSGLGFFLTQRTDVRMAGPLLV